MTGWEGATEKMNEMLARPIAVKPRDGYRVWVKFDDGEEGEVDYSHIPRNGVFAAWNDREVFERVYISEFHSLTWPGGLELCPNSTYMRLTGKTVEELMPSLARRL